MSNVLAPLAFLIAAIGLYFTYIRPANDTLQAFRAQEERLNTALADYEQLRTKNEELREQYQLLKAGDIEKLNRILPDMIDPVRVIIDFDALALKNNITIMSFDIPRITEADPYGGAVGGSSDGPIYGQAVISLECRGTYEDMKAFLRSLESSMTLMDVINLDVDTDDATTAQGEPIPGSMGYNLGIQMYWLH